MRDQLSVLVAGFLLTGVLGGSLGYVFQRRAWAHQHRVERAEHEHRLAMATFEELSSLLDKRLYRMRQVFWAARRVHRDGADDNRLQAALDDYREVLTTWNDNQNRIMALTSTYFGYEARRALGVDIYDQFTAIGWALDDFVRRVTQDPAGAEVPPLARRLNFLSSQIFALNSRMLLLLQTFRDTERKTLRARARLHYTDTKQPDLVEFGRRGYQASRLQRALRRAGESPGAIDGAFGPDTERALRSFQQAHQLVADAVAGPSTWAALPTGHYMRSLQEGSTGKVVARLQAVLTEYAPDRWNTTPSRTDGVFDAATTSAVQAFQRWRNLNADGIVGETTWATELDAPGHTLESRVGLDLVGF